MAQNMCCFGVYEPYEWFQGVSQTHVTMRKQLFAWGNLLARSPQVSTGTLVALAQVALAQEPCGLAGQPQFCTFVITSELKLGWALWYNSWGHQGLQLCRAAPQLGDLGITLASNCLKKCQNSKICAILAPKHGPKNVPRAGETPDKIIQCFT